MGSTSWRSTGRTDAPAASAASRIRSTPKPPPAPCWPGWPPPRPSDATASSSPSGRSGRPATVPPEARTAAINQLNGLLVTAPASLREALEGRSTAALAAACARLRPDETALADPVNATKAALRVVACRIQQLDEEIGVADQRLAKLVGRAAPRLLKLHAIGVDHAGQLLTTTGQRPERLRNEAAFAHLCGPRRSPPARARSTGTGYTVAVTATPTGRCTWPWWSACAGVRAPAPMPSDAPSKGAPSQRSCAASSATWPARSTTPSSPTSRHSTRLDDLYEHPGIPGGLGMPLVVVHAAGTHTASGLVGSAVRWRLQRPARLPHEVAD